VSQRALQRLRALGYAGVDDVEEGGVEPGEGPTFPVEAAAAAAPFRPVPTTRRMSAARHPKRADP